MKRALVLSGGGSKGAFEVGAVEFLVRESGLDFDVFLGTSVGALNASILAQARNYHDLVKQAQLLKDLWLDIKGDYSIFSTSILGVFRLLFTDSLHTPDGLRCLIEKNIDPEKLFNNPRKVLKVTTVAEETGELFYADNRSPELKNDFLSYILASASIPLFFPAVHINGKHWYDGGLRDITPLGAVFKEQPDEIVVILTFPIDHNLAPTLAPARRRGAFGAILRTVEIMNNEISSNDLQMANLINQNHLNFPGKKCVPVHIIAPEKPITGEHILQFHPEAIRENLKRGFQAAQNPRILCKKTLSQVR